MATTLAPVDARDVVRCDQCHLVQFKTVNNLCRRCRMSLEEDEPEPILTPPLPMVEPERSGVEVQVATVIRMLRQRNGLSQRQLALRICGPSRQDEINELLADPFLAELTEFTSKLNAMQLSSVLGQVRDMVEHPRRYTQN